MRFHPFKKILQTKILILIFSSDAGDADLKVQVIHDETKKEIPTRVLDNGDNTYSVELSPTEAGSYTTNLFYGGLKVPTSPKTIVNPPIDVTKVKVDGLEPSEYFFFFIFLFILGLSLCLHFIKLSLKTKKNSRSYQ